jgi:hypothetical protein
MSSRLQLSKPRFGIAEASQLHAHPIHNRKIQAAKLAVIVALTDHSNAAKESPPRN